MHRPERQALEEALKTAPAGSAKIQALADYAMLKEIEHDMQRESVSEGELLDLWARKTVIELAIEQRQFSKDAHAYLEAFDNAGEILTLYVAKHDIPWRSILGDLKDINLGKAKKKNETSSL